MIRALLWKEWREQRWRAVLGAFVLVTLSASIIRAQIVTTSDAVFLVFGPFGLIFTIFLAMGSVATEREDRTWPFLIALPMRTATVLRAKWALGAAELVVVLMLSGVAMHLAAVSRDLFTADAVARESWFRVSSNSAHGVHEMGAAEDVARWATHVLGLSDLLEYSSPNSAAWLWTIVVSATTAMLAMYSVLFVVLTRARNELHAGVAGLLLSIVVLVWLQYYVATFVQRDAMSDAGRYVLLVSSIANPLSPLVYLAESAERQLLASVIVFSLWIALPLALLGSRHVYER